MDNKSKIVPATVRQAREMAPKMRKADIQEIWAATGEMPDEALIRSIQSATGAWAGYWDNEICCIFGVSPESIISGKGNIWMLGTELIEKHPTVFLRHSVQVVKDMHKSYRYLHNWVDVRNEVSIRWLKWLGFTLEKPAPFGPYKMLFRKFYKEIK